MRFLLSNVGSLASVKKIADKEVDFVARTTNGLKYYQVSVSVLPEATLARELEPFCQIPDNHPKTLLTLDEIPRRANYDGIQQIHIIDWLLA